MATMIERSEGHYEVRRISYGEAYIWCPESVVVDCDCGARLVLNSSETVCSCGIDHAHLVGETSSHATPDGPLHPWDAEYREWLKEQGEHVLSEETYWLELSTLD
jgi:hypothetical protein